MSLTHPPTSHNVKRGNWKKLLKNSKIQNHVYKPLHTTNDFRRLPFLYRFEDIAIFRSAESTTFTCKAARVAKQALPSCGGARNCARHSEGRACLATARGVIFNIAFQAKLQRV